MSSLHVVAEWALVIGVGVLVLLVIGAVLRVAAWADGICPEPPVRVRSHRGRDGITRRYWLTRASDADELYIG